jgi:O-antigen ligase
LALLTIAFFSITRLDIFKERFVTGFKDDLTRTTRNGEVADSRIMRWRCAFTLIKQAPVAGHGTGSERNLLKEKYFERKLYNSYLHELNAHNQYLSFLIKTGFVGLMVFITTLCIGFITAWKNKDFTFLSFMILIGLVSLSENILDVNKGIFFYAFFFTYFMLSGKLINSMLPLRKKLK